jgi:DHA3 family macrolide efflux protein-like MFS transporter
MMINFLLAPSGTLMPLLVTDHFNGEAIQLGLIDSAWGLGAVAGGVLLGVWGGFKRRIFTSLTGVAGIGVGVLIMGMAPANMFWLAIAGSVFIGVMNATANAPLQAIMQARVAPEMQGRVFTVIGSFCTAMMPLAMLVAAPVAELSGVRTWFVMGGILTMIMGAGAFFVRDLRHIEDTQPEELPVPAAALASAENA